MSYFVEHIDIENLLKARDRFEEKRSISSHSYDEENVLSVVAIFDNFSQALTELIDKLKKHHDTY